MRPVATIATPRFWGSYIEARAVEHALQELGLKSLRTFSSDTAHAALPRMDRLRHLRMVNPTSGLESELCIFPVERQATIGQRHL